MRPAAPSLARPPARAFSRPRLPRHLRPPPPPPPRRPSFSSTPPDARAASYGDNEDPYPSLSDYHDYEPNLEFDDTELQSASPVTGKTTTTASAAAASSRAPPRASARPLAAKISSPPLRHALPASFFLDDRLTPAASPARDAALALHDSLASAAVCLVTGDLHGSLHSRTQVTDDGDMHTCIRQAQARLCMHGLAPRTARSLAGTCLFTQITNTGSRDGQDSWPTLLALPSYSPA